MQAATSAFNDQHSMSRLPLLPLLSAFTLALSVASAAAQESAAAPTGFPAGVHPLVLALQRAGYTVLLKKPPIDGAYGATNARKKMIWVAPITIDLGILRQALIHEAVHAAQGCPSGKLRPIGWSFPMANAVDREVAGVLYRNYAHAKHDVEREAFAMQGDPRAFERIAAALKQRCR